MFLVITSCQSTFFLDKIDEIMGVDDVEVFDRESIDVFGGFGEGYTLEVYKLSHSTIQSFLNKPSKKLPRKHSNGWNIKDWDTSPLDNDYKEIYTLVFDYFGNKKLTNRLKKLKNLMSGEGVYYSFYYYPDRITPIKVRFFIIDIKKDTFYAIDVAQ